MFMALVDHEPQFNRQREEGKEGCFLYLGRYRVAFGGIGKKTQCI